MYRMIQTTRDRFFFSVNFGRTNWRTAGTRRESTSWKSDIITKKFIGLPVWELKEALNFGNWGSRLDLEII